MSLKRALELITGLWKDINKPMDLTQGVAISASDCRVTTSLRVGEMVTVYPVAPYFTAVPVVSQMILRKLRITERKK